MSDVLHPRPGGSAFCPHCGSSLRTTADVTTERGRGGMMFAFGITNIVMLGPILGVRTNWKGAFHVLSSLVCVDTETPRP